MIAAVLPALLALAPPVTSQMPAGKTQRETARWLMQQGDIAELQVYAEANRALIAATDERPRIILLGDSITYHWPEETLPALPGALIVNRGIPGQNTTQMLLRFEDDVVALRPAAVVILAGTNDLRSLGPHPAPRDAVVGQIARNVTAMADIADARRIRVILCTIPPVGPDQATGQRDPATILAANEWLRGFAAVRGHGFLDYHGALAGKDGLIRAAYTSDDLHLTPTGYQQLWALLATAARRALER